MANLRGLHRLSMVKEPKRMDEYGICTVLDAPHIAQRLRTGGSLLVSLTNDNRNAYIILLVPKFTVLGQLPFGGKPTGSCCVSVLGQGFYYFNLFRETDNPLTREYVGDKLNLYQFDAKVVTEFLNDISQELSP